MEIVTVINHTAPSLDYLLHSIKYDSTHGYCRHAADLSISEQGTLVFKGRHIQLVSQRDPADLDWKDLGAEYIIEATGKSTTHELASRHIKSGAKKVVISAPSKDSPTIVVGVNRKQYASLLASLWNSFADVHCL